jgi:hypothetical protein
LYFSWQNGVLELLHILRSFALAPRTIVVLAAKELAQLARNSVLCRGATNRNKVSSLLLTRSRSLDR